MRLKKFDKILFWILVVFIVVAYGLFYWSSRQSSIQSTNMAKSVFFLMEISDTIKRIDPIYKDDCNTSFWIVNYPAHNVVIDLCKYPQLRNVRVGNVIQKKKNSSDCIIIDENGKLTRIKLKIEY